MAEPAEKNAAREAATEPDQPDYRNMSDEELTKLLTPCDAGPLQQYLGQDVAIMSEAEWLDDSGAGQLRIARPGQPISRDYRTDRLTLLLDDEDRVQSARCG